MSFSCQEHEKDIELIEIAKCTNLTILTQLQIIPIFPLYANTAFFQISATKCAELTTLHFWPKLPQALRICHVTYTTNIHFHVVQAADESEYIRYKGYKLHYHLVSLQKLLCSMFGQWNNIINIHIHTSFIFLRYLIIRLNRFRPLLIIINIGKFRVNMFQKMDTVYVNDKMDVSCSLFTKLMCKICTITRKAAEDKKNICKTLYHFFF